MGKISSLQTSINRQAKTQDRVKEAYVDQNLLTRNEAIASWYQDGGDIFLQWAKQYYCIYSGERLRWEEVVLEDYYRLLGEPYVRDLIIEKGSQMGYTESLIAFAAFFLAYLKVPVGFGFEEHKKLMSMVGSRVQTAFSHCKPIQEISEEQRKLIGRKDVDTKENITVGGIKASFFHAGANKGGDATAGVMRQASSRLSSFTAFAIIADEIELWKPGILDVCRRRMDATILKSEILRAGSTPGHEGGLVDSMVKNADHLFQWYVTCSCCGESQALDAFGNLLKATEVLEEGKVNIRYLDRSGRPLNWFYHQYNTYSAYIFLIFILYPSTFSYRLFLSNYHGMENDRIDNAYIGCRYCEEEITKDIIAQGEYRCTLTNISLNLFFSRLRETERVVNRVALRLPKLGLMKFSPPDRIRELFETDNPADSVQQGLGKPYSLGSGKIQYEVIMECVGLELPEKEKKRGYDLVTLGCDQGRYTNYVVVCGWNLAEEPTKELKWRRAHKTVIWYGQVDTLKQLDALVEKYNVLVVGIDSEPEWETATAYALNNPPKGPTVLALDNFATSVKVEDAYSARGERGGVISGLSRTNDSLDEAYWSSYTSGMKVLGQVYLFDQVELNKAEYKRNLRPIKSHISQKIPVYSIDRTYWLDMVRDRIYLRHTHLPAGLTFNSKDKNNFIYHLLSSDRLIAERRWVEGGAPDHYFHALSFNEGVMFVSMFENGV